MIANAEFDHILLVINRLSKCSLFSLLHIEPKQESRVWHPYGDFRRLKVFTVPVISMYDFAIGLQRARISPRAVENIVP